MIKRILLFSTAVLLLSFTPDNQKDEKFDYIADRFADIQVLRYKVDGFENLSLRQKKLAYYLYQAGLSGRDIFYDQKYKNSILIRKSLEAILNSYPGVRKGVDWDKFELYCKKFFFANGNHHHYSSEKFTLTCEIAYFKSLVEGCDERCQEQIIVRPNERKLGVRLELANKRKSTDLPT